jgi:hypothetical protein
MTIGFVPCGRFIEVVNSNLLNVKLNPTKPRRNKQEGVLK